MKTDAETVSSLKSKVDSTQAQAENLKAELDSFQQRKAQETETEKTVSKEIGAKKKVRNG